MKFSIEEISSMSNFTKFINWLKLSGFKGIIHKLFIIIFIIYFSIILYFKQKKLLVYGLISLLNCVIIYMFSAQYRFMLPILLGLLFIIFCSLKILCCRISNSLNFRRSFLLSCRPNYSLVAQLVRALH